MKFLTVSLATALLASSGTAAAQSASDAECIILSNVFASEAKDANAQKAAQAALYFYLGRISDKTTPAQLKTLLDAQAKALDDKTAGPKMNACVQAIQTKVQMMQSLSPQQQPQTKQPPKQPQGR